MDKVIDDIEDLRSFFIIDVQWYLAIKTATDNLLDYDPPEQARLLEVVKREVYHAFRKRNR